MPKLKVTLPGEEWLWDTDEMPLSELVTVESELDGKTYTEWLGGIVRKDAASMQVLVWYLRRKAGTQQDRRAVDFPFNKLEIENVDEVEPDPEAPAGSEPAA